MAVAEPYHTTDETTLYLGDSLNILPALPDASVDAVVTDPPYGLTEHAVTTVLKAVAAWMAGDRTHVPDGRGFMGKDWDRFVPPPGVWDECLRVLKPGGHLVAFAGARTVDLMTLSIRIAGFEVRDSLHWVYGSGFPKSLDVSKAIDKAAGAEREVVATRRGAGLGSAASFAQDEWTAAQRGARDLALTAPATAAAARWQGWGTALKPAHEPIVLARKPLAGTVAGNVLEHGTGALNIDACRVAGEPWKAHRATGLASTKFFSEGDAAVIEKQPHEAGRWPSNVILTHPPVVDEQGQPVGDACADGCISGCPVAEMDRQSGTLTSGKMRAGTRRSNRDGWAGPMPAVTGTETYGDSGGASRFFPVFRYEAKAASSERPRSADGTAHPTVKPLALIQWLARLITPPSGTVLDPFAGSGTTLEACLVEGLHAIGIERHQPYADLCVARLTKPITPYLFG